MVEQLRNFTSLYFLDRSLTDFTNDYIYKLLLEVLILLGKCCFQFLATFITALIITYLQVGFVFSSDPLTPS